MTERRPTPFGMRFPPGMHERLKAEAKANGRSLSTEIIRRLGGEPPERTMRQPKAVPAVHPRIRRSFLMGFGSGVAGRLYEMTRERHERRKAAASASAGADLVVLKQALVDSYVAQTYPMIRTAKRGKVKADMAAAGAGLLAGSRMNIARPLGKAEDMEAVDG